MALPSKLVALTEPYANAQPSRALWQLGSTLIVYALLLYFINRSLDVSVGLSVIFYLFAVGVLVRLFALQHDCGHQSFLREKWQNDLVGSVLGVLTLTPYEWWLRLHARHHAASGDLDRHGVGEIRTLTVKDYLKASPARRLRYRIYRSPIFLFFIAAPLHVLCVHRLPFGDQMKEARAWLTVMSTNAAIAWLAFGFASVLGWSRVLLIYVPIVACSAAIGTWLVYIQHQFERTYWQRTSAWEFEQASIRGSSFYDLPRMLHWFTGNIGYHHIHHVRTKVPNYRLSQCHQENPALQDVTPLTLWKSLQSLRLALWDEDSERMVPLPRWRGTNASLGLGG